MSMSTLLCKTLKTRQFFLFLLFAFICNFCCNFNFEPTRSGGSSNPPKNIQKNRRNHNKSSKCSRNNLSARPRKTAPWKTLPKITESTTQRESIGNRWLLWLCRLLRCCPYIVSCIEVCPPTQTLRARSLPLPELLFVSMNR